MEVEKKWGAPPEYSIGLPTNNLSPSAITSQQTSAQPTQSPLPRSGLLDTTQYKAAESTAVKTPAASQALLNQTELTPGGLVENRVADIVESNSPLMQRAAARANAESNSRGLLNSSMAIGAAHGAVMDAATPIAQADAAATNNINLSNTQAANQNEQYNASNRQQVDLTNQTAENSTNQFNASAQNALIGEKMRTAADMAKQDQAIAADLLKQDKAIAAENELQMQQIRAKAGEQANAAISQAYDTYSRLREHLQSNPDMTTESKMKAIAELDMQFSAYLKTFEALDADGVTGLVDFTGLAENREDQVSGQEAIAEALKVRQSEWDKKAAALGKEPPRMISTPNFSGGSGGPRPNPSWDKWRKEMDALGPRPIE